MGSEFPERHPVKWMSEIVPNTYCDDCKKSDKTVQMRKAHNASLCHSCTVGRLYKEFKLGDTCGCGHFVENHYGMRLLPCAYCDCEGLHRKTI